MVLVRQVRDLCQVRQPHRQRHPVPLGALPQHPHPRHLGLGQCAGLQGLPRLRAPARRGRKVDRGELPARNLRAHLRRRCGGRGSAPAAAQFQLLRRRAGLRRLPQRHVHPVQGQPLLQREGASAGADRLRLPRRQGRRHLRLPHRGRSDGLAGGQGPGADRHCDPGAAGKDPVGARKACGKRCGHS